MKKGAFNKKQKSDSTRIVQFGREGKSIEEQTKVKGK